MKKDSKKRFLSVSLVTALLLGTSAYAGKIVGASPTDDVYENKQFGFGGLNLENVVVKMTDLNFNETTKTFNPTNGTYDPMEVGDTFESDVYSITEPSKRMGYLHQKIWPLSEPTGIKIINDDIDTSNGKPENCIMASSYLLDENLATTSPKPVICSSPPGSNKRLSLFMTSNTVANPDNDGYGQPVELVFNIEADGTTRRYQVFQKINNYTGMRLDGYKIEVVNKNGQVDPNLTLSLGIDEKVDKDGEYDPADPNLWDEDEFAFYAPGLWGNNLDKSHLPPFGWFDDSAAGFHVSLSQDASTLIGGFGATSGDTTLPGNYIDIFGIWMPGKWQPIAMNFDEDSNPLTEDELIAFWGTVPNAPVGTAPAWHKGKDYDLSDGDQSWSAPTPEELLTWLTDERYVQSHIEDVPNLSLNYIVNVGEASSIGETFIVRVSPHIAQDQTRPNYIEDDNVTYIEPPTSYVDSRGIVTISPAPTFTPGVSLSVGVADGDLNTNEAIKETVNITVTADTGDTESVTLTETDVDSGIFSGTLDTENSTSAPVANNGIMTTIADTVVTATYEDTNYGSAGTVEILTALTRAAIPTDDDTDNVVDSDGNPASSGGGCTYNPNAKSFDMTFLLMMALGLFYPFRRRFIK